MSKTTTFLGLSLVIGLFCSACGTPTPGRGSGGGGKEAASGGDDGKGGEGQQGGASGDAGSSEVSRGGGGGGGGAKVGTGGKNAGGTGVEPKPGSGGSAGRGGSGGKGGGGSATGGIKADASTPETGTPGGSRVDYALPPPSQCHNQFFIPYEEGCKPGDSSSTCGGKCQVINAGMESLESKPGADVTFMCPRAMLFSDEMMQAATDDGNDDFNYAVVGHDVDKGGIDGNVESTCCQCYQLVYAYPSPNNDKQVLADPDHPNPPVSAIPLPKPLIAQSFNTAATPTTFDVYMAGGGLGANNACAAVAGSKSASGKYMYTSYPEDGQPSQGGVKPVSLYTECKTQTQWVTAETLSSPACQAKVEKACNKIESKIPGLAEQSRRSCLQSNDPKGDYHLNWSVYVAKVECPEHLTQVTGCKLASQGLPKVKRDVTTSEKAAADSDFWKKSSQGGLYETTTMEDCCRPSCANKDWVEKKGLKADPKYNAFYSCDENGKVITEKASQ